MISIAEMYLLKICNLALYVIVDMDLYLRSVFVFIYRSGFAIFFMTSGFKFLFICLGACTSISVYISACVCFCLYSGIYFL